MLSPRLLLKGLNKPEVATTLEIIDSIPPSVTGNMPFEEYVVNMNTLPGTQTSAVRSILNNELGDVVFNNYAYGEGAFNSEDGELALERIYTYYTQNFNQPGFAVTYDWETSTNYSLPIFGNFNWFPLYPLAAFYAPFRGYIEIRKYLVP